MNNKLKSLLLILFVVFTTNIYSQDDYLIEPWDAKLKFGNSLLWGDGASTDNVFNRFISKETRPVFGLNLQRNLSPTFGLYGSFNMGWIYGERPEWTSVSYHPVITSNVDYFDYHLGLNVDFTSMFGFKEDRLLSIYAFGGAGMVHYNANSFADGVIHQKVNSQALIVPWGVGAKIRLTDKYYLFFENSFRHTFVDDIDAYEGSGTDVDDIYSLTSIGFACKFHFKERKSSDSTEDIDDYPQSIDPVKEKDPVRYASNLPDEIVSDSLYEIKVILAKDSNSIQGPLKYTLSLPQGCYVKDVESKGAFVDNQVHSLTLEWEDVPLENIAISYTLVTELDSSIKGNAIISTRVEYTKDNEPKMDIFNHRVSISQKQIKQSSVSQDIVTLDTPSNDLDLVYSVQIATVFNKPSSPERMQNYFELEDSVYQISYKNSYRYMVGSFDSYGDALQHSALKTIKGAYVVVLNNGKYYVYMYQTNDLVKDTNGILPDQTTYKVQISASKGRPYPIAKLAYKYGVVEDDITETKVKSWYQYSVGTFSTREEAQVFLKKMQKINPQAYIVKFE